MSNMKEIRKKNDGEIAAYVTEKREEVRSFRFGTAGAATRNVRSVRTAKKEIARSLTELNARARSESNKGA
jgi:ribosomal protein L29